MSRPGRRGAGWSVLLATVAGLVTLLVAPGSTAAAGGDPSTSVGGRLTTTDDEGGRIPVEGVVIVVRDADGREIGRATSGADGSWSVPLPGAGTYRVELDTSTLPEGVRLRNPDRAVLDAVPVDDGQAKVVRFVFGEFTSGVSTSARIINLVAQGVTFGLVIALASVGLSLIFGITGLVNFAHGELVALGALVAWWANASAGGPHWHLTVAAALAVAVGAAGGLGLEHGLWRPLRRRGVGRIALLVVSIGLAFVLRHVYLVLYGGAPRPYRDYTIQREVAVGPVSLPPKDYAIIAIATVVLVAVGVMLLRTRMGTAMRAVADNRDLAEASGIDVNAVIRTVWVLGGALAALGGVLQGLTESVVWDMGFSLLLLMFAAVIVGGLGTAFGAMAGGLLIGVVSQVSTFWFDVEFKLVFALGALIVVLLFRPQGLFGHAERIG